MLNNDIKIAFIGGSGIYELDGIKEIKEISVKTPFGNPSDKIITGILDGVKVAFLPRHGRGHYIIPAEINFRANIFALKKLGAKIIISASAVGSMREDIAPGDIVVVDQFFDRTRLRASSFFGNGLVAHVGFSQPICQVISESVFSVVKSEGVQAHKGGVYLCIEGPQFSTLGESNIYRKWGVDVIGMTAIPEAKLAREAEICYSVMALVTDYDCWHAVHESVTADVVIKQIKKNVAQTKKILSRLIPQLSKNADSDCSCRHALKGAIMTDPAVIDKEMKKRLDILVEKYI